MIAIELFGREVPTPGIGLLAVVLFVLFFLVNRSTPLVGGGGGPGGSGRAGRGRMYECTRCGRRFQPEHVEVLPNGQTNVFYDDRCPNCGWDLDWGNADKKPPGGASGGW